jgi:hypothetical protein
MTWMWWWTPWPWMALWASACRATSEERLVAELRAELDREDAAEALAGEAGAGGGHS